MCLWVQPRIDMSHALNECIFQCCWKPVNFPGLCPSGTTIFRLQRCAAWWERGSAHFLFHWIGIDHGRSVSLSLSFSVYVWVNIKPPFLGQHPNRSQPDPFEKHTGGTWRHYLVIVNSGIEIMNLQAGKKRAEPLHSHAVQTDFNLRIF